jgi:hypothetical protein
MTRLKTSLGSNLKRTIEIVRFECAHTFAGKAVAENRGLEVASMGR